MRHRTILTTAGACLALTLALLALPRPAGATWPPTRAQAQAPPVVPFAGAVTYRLFATREGLVGGTTANGHVITPRDHFVALPSATALAAKDGHDKQVLITYHSRRAVAPVWDVGPWNVHDNFWDPPARRETGKGLPRGWPAAQAQYFDHYMNGVSDKGYQVNIPAGIDIADGTFWDDLGMTDADWVDVTFLWFSPGGDARFQPLPPAVLLRAGAIPTTPTQTYFPQSGHTLRDTFKRYWETHGGLAQFGFPLTEPFLEASADDGQTYLVQYFERARFELHPEHAGTPYEVELGFLGKAFHQPDPPTTARPGARFFPETGHNLGGRFRAYWEAHGGLSVYGLPLTEEIQEVSPTDGQTYTVQYFERARFEEHPENPAPYDVLLGQLGRQLLTLRSAAR
ncbi:MAG TPA: SH3 domain-containing protein [Thermomicrobiales bacterium]|nr:SH3 domain-containing protein [Thermomicrobiales bacterium]